MSAKELGIIDTATSKKSTEEKSAVVNGYLPDEGTRRKIRRRRAIKDRLARYGVGAGGGGVVVVLALIFVYLFIEVLPLFVSARLDDSQSYSLSLKDESGTCLIAMERYQELAVRFASSGEATFFEAATGKVRHREILPLPPDATITSFGKAEARTGVVAFGLSDGRVFVAKHDYDLTYPDNKRYIAPKIVYPLGESALVVDSEGKVLKSIAVQQSAGGIAIAAVTEDDRLLLVLYSSSESFLTGEVEVTREAFELPSPPESIFSILVDTTTRNLFIADNSGNVHYYDISEPDNAGLIEIVSVLKSKGSSITALDFLLGSVSLIVGDSSGNVSQWFLVRDEKNIHHLTHIRDFEPHKAAVVAISPEYNRKGFVTGDNSGVVAIHYSTSNNTVLRQKISDGSIENLAISPVNNALLAIDAKGNAKNYKLTNLHPEVSISILWSKVWYEGRSGPEYIWQSSSATDDFEGKFSMIPLAVGTLKGAVFAMLFAIPLGVMGAIYAAYFMTPRLRGIVKPTIEIMAALPTVILGFLAGLWLAPFIENNLPAIFSIIILTPLFMLGFAFLWHKLPAVMKHKIPSSGWEVVFLIPVIVASWWMFIQISPMIEVAFFDGSMRQWMTGIGINYDQRNALVVGIAMGFAVIPTIFSMAEDAVFAVPKHLTQGSLALGATPWQTMSRVVLLTASPGIFAAVMIGFGRAVGETMIVLMATGNSPIVNFNIFEGMRTLSANIAVELPETAVGSSHYRVLFLAALVLFAMTFLVNTIAEMVRQRLRRKYSSL